MTVHGGIAARRGLVEALREQHRRTDIDRRAPELGEQLALDADVLDERRVGLWRNRSDLLIERQRDARRVRGIDVDLHRLGIEIARLLVPMLPLTHIRR